MNNFDLVIKSMRHNQSCYLKDTEPWKEYEKAIEALEKQISKKVYHFLDDDTFETTCCGIDVTNKDYNYCPNCGCKLGEVEEVEVKDE